MALSLGLRATDSLFSCIVSSCRVWWEWLQDGSWKNDVQTKLVVGSCVTSGMPFTLCRLSPSFAPGLVHEVGCGREGGCCLLWTPQGSYVHQMRWGGSEHLESRLVRPRGRDLLLKPPLAGFAGTPDRPGAVTGMSLREAKENRGPWRAVVCKLNHCGAISSNFVS